MSGGLYSTEGRDFDQTLDLKKIKPYGDTMNDGKTQLSFTLPVPAGDEAIEAAKQLMKRFVSLDAIKAASVEQLAEVESMNEQAAQNVYEFFHKKDS